MKAKTVAEINARLKRGEAIVMTVHELKAAIRAGRRLALEDVDVVTTATQGIMSGTAAAFSVPVAERGRFTRATEAWINGVPGFPGPAPNERLGYVDLMIYGTSASRDDPARYGGGHLFRELVERKEVTIEVRTDSGQRLARRFTLDELDFARMYNFRNAFRAYMAFGNFKSDQPLRTIFSFRPMGPDSGISAVGSGEVNPIQNDPRLRTIGVGTQAFVNDAPGVVVGGGTRATPERPSLSIVADMFPMKARYMGGVVTGEGLEVLNSVSIAIPVLDDEVLRGLLECLDERLPLPVADVADRLPVDEITYADVWQGRDLTVTLDASRACPECGRSCAAQQACPVGAVLWSERRIDPERCIRCGACAVVCRNGAFQADLGSVVAAGASRPITFRTSDRVRAMELAESLKDRLLQGLASVVEKIADVDFHKKP